MIESSINDLAAAVRELTAALAANQLAPGLKPTASEEHEPEPAADSAPVKKSPRELQRERELAQAKAAAETPAPKAAPKAKAAPVAEEDPAEPTAATQSDGEHTQQDVRNAALSAIKAGKSADVKKILAKAGATQISDLDEAAYGSTIKALKALLK